MTSPFRVEIGAARSGANGLPPVDSLEQHTPAAADLEESGIVALGNGAQARPINLLRGQLIKRAAKHGFQLIGVTSAAPGAGKSFVTTNLAVALSRIAGQQVALLDLDLRRPAIGERLSMRAETGLDAWLTGATDDLRQIGRRFGESGLAIYPSNALNDQASDVLATPRFDVLVETLRQLPQSAIVLCDLPPAFVSDDALTVIGKLDAYIHVIEEGVTPKRQAEELKAMMDPAPCLGAVLNHYSGRFNDSYGYAASRRYSRYYTSDQ